MVHLPLICIKIRFLINDKGGLQDMVCYYVFKEKERLLLIHQLNETF